MVYIAPPGSTNPLTPKKVATTGPQNVPGSPEYDAAHPGYAGSHEASGPGTTAVHIAQAPSPKVASIRKQLIQAGYNVNPSGAGTVRLSKAYAHFIATKGGGAQVWNAHNVQVTHPGVAQGDRVTGPLHATYTPPGNGEQVPATTIPGAPTLPAGLQALLDKEFAPYSGDTGQPTIVDPVKLAQSQANMQYGGQIDQSKTNIAQMLGAEPGAQANITNYFAPNKDQAAAAITSDDAANAENVAAQAKLSPGLMAALGLTGAAGGNLAANNEANIAAAGNLGTITHADDLANQAATDRREQQAHTTEAANSTIGVANARQQLLEQLATKGNAQSVDEATNRQQNFANRTQGIANAGEISNINATRGLAKTNIIKGMLDNAGQAQTQDINKSNADITQGQYKAQAKQAAANLQQTLINNKRLTETPIPGKPGQTYKIPFSSINVGDRDSLAAGLWAKVVALKLPPDKAEQQINQYMTSLYGYQSTPAIRAFAKATVQQHQWDAKNKKYKQ